MLRGTGISTHVPRTGHDAQNKPFFFFADWISIHAPRTGRDPPCCRGTRVPRNFNPRAPYGARRADGAHVRDGVHISIHVPRTGHDRQLLLARFQAEISIQVPRTGHDVLTIGMHSRYLYFNPRAPYGARHHIRVDDLLPLLISIHVPRTGHDLCFSMSLPFMANFNPRAPYGARRRQGVHVFHCLIISIHVPRTGHDSKNAQIVFCIFAITDNKSGKVIM